MRSGNKFFEEIMESYEKETESFIVERKKNIIIAFNHSVDYMLAEADKIYESCIKQFYSYPTKKYIRHHELTWGTCKGTNLYKSKPYKLTKYGGMPQSLMIDFSVEGMEGYDDPYKTNATPESVLNSVVNGSRGIGGRNINNNDYKWEAKDINVFGVSKSGTPKKIFNYYCKQFDDTFEKRIEMEFTKLQKG